MQNNNVISNKINSKGFSPLFEKYQINVCDIEFVSDVKIELSLAQKVIILEKLLEAHELALTNVKAGNITGRGFATNVCTYDGFWSIGTNFNNTRNDISSICGERSAILTAYNDALVRYSINPDDEFQFKIKYMCMAQSVNFEDLTKPAVPCEDCLSWLNTNRYFDDNTTIFSFEKNKENTIFVKAIKLYELLPFKDIKTSSEYMQNKKIEYSAKAKLSIEKYNYKNEDIYELLKQSYSSYNSNILTKISNQNISCSIKTDNKIYTANKNDWTKRWHNEPLEMATYSAINNEDNLKINAIAYFGDEYSINANNKFHDGVVSIKSLGRIRQKYATNNTILILNLQDKILVVTLGEYLPKKFIQGYKIV